MGSTTGAFCVDVYLISKVFLLMLATSFEAVNRSSLFAADVSMQESSESQPDFAAGLVVISIEVMFSKLSKTLGVKLRHSKSAVAGTLMADIYVLEFVKFPIATKLTLNTPPVQTVKFKSAISDTDILFFIT